jgi:acyl-CoA thioesterase I
LRSIRILLFALLMTGGALAAPQERTLLIFGDSLSAAYGLQTEQGWVAQLQKRLNDQGYGYRVVNASVSGETSAGGRSRLQRALDQHRPELVVLELGANDGLRGLPVKDLDANLKAMVAMIQKARARLLLVGILIPPNYGPRYTRSFSDMYLQLAKSQSLPFIPFLLDGVALDSRYMQQDGMHPNATGQPLVLENVWKQLQPMLTR